MKEQRKPFTRAEWLMLLGIAFFLCVTGYSALAQVYPTQEFFSSGGGTIVGPTTTTSTFTASAAGSIWTDVLGSTSGADIEMWDDIDMLDNRITSSSQQLQVGSSGACYTNVSATDEVCISASGDAGLTATNFWVAVDNYVLRQAAGRSMIWTRSGSWTQPIGKISARDDVGWLFTVDPNDNRGQNYILFAPLGTEEDTTFGTGTPAPTLTIRLCSNDPDSSPTDCIDFTHDQTDGVITPLEGGMHINGTYVRLADQVKGSLPDNVATTFATMAVASGSHVSGIIQYAIYASDAGGDLQVEANTVPFVAANKAGTITCDIGTTPASFNAQVVTAGTLSVDFTCADAGSNVLNLKITSDTSLTTTTHEIHYTLFLNETAVVTPQ